ncbi:MAG: endoribonuclease MazF [Spirochaetales bacterium]|nr:endoribonuclease MazF [Spirochaetales bacterium]
MVKADYIPERGDLIWLNFTPQSGHEQAGKRPAIVLSPQKYNRKTGLLITCPITSKIKGYPFEVAVEGQKISGVILSDQIKNFDWKTRNAVFIEKASIEIVKNVQEKLLLLIQ